VQIGIDSHVLANKDADHHITADNCGDFKSIDHSVGVVGFGSSSAKGDFYIVKNSWSKYVFLSIKESRCRNWGDNGFVYVARGVACGNIFGSGAHVYTQGDPDFYYE